MTCELPNSSGGKTKALVLRLYLSVLPHLIISYFSEDEISPRVEPVLQLGLQTEDEEFFQTLMGKIVAVGVGILLVIIILILISTIIFISCKRGRRFRHGEWETERHTYSSIHLCLFT